MLSRIHVLFFRPLRSLWLPFVLVIAFKWVQYGLLYISVSARNWKQGGAHGFLTNLNLEIKSFWNVSAHFFLNTSLAGTGSHTSLRRTWQRRRLALSWYGTLPLLIKLWSFRWEVEEWGAVDMQQILLSTCETWLLSVSIKTVFSWASPVSALCPSWWRVSSGTLLNKLCDLLNCVKIA